MTSDPLRIDIVSDVVCPWCIIGYRQLDRAIRDSGVAVTILWHPFELNPDMPPEGQDLRAHMAEKYGSTAQESAQARDRLTRLGAELGFAFNFSDQSRMVNTFRAHQLIEWAETQGRQTEMKLALFRAHFTDARDVSDMDMLAAIAGETGLDPADAREALETERFAPEVRTIQRFWAEKGIRGVPAMVFDLQHLVTGAQGVETYGALLNRLSADRAG
ncbi:MAG: putative dithiol-disulfide isomerase involved in polyketide biosynthesis [Rhodobacteraceae bacterium HLUCCO07]|nr:MAG: putative dithiol-disulfide isomerase involved in polyketide biosynthesis [Rhodobacteraceae bacterium HLUCCO07]